MLLEVKGEAIELDRERYLLDPSRWNKDVAQAIADKEHIELTDDVWEVVNFVRDYFEDRQSVPEHRL